MPTLRPSLNSKRLPSAPARRMRTSYLICKCHLFYHFFGLLWYPSLKIQCLGFLAVKWIFGGGSAGGFLYPVNRHLFAVVVLVQYGNGWLIG